MGHSLTRPADGMVMAYVPGGTFIMDSTDHAYDALSAYRTWFHPDATYSEWDVIPGFRCAQDSE